MYIVVSRWEPLPGKSDDFESTGRKMRNLLRQQSGVKLMEGFRTEDGGAVAIVGYESRDAYDRIVNDENGAFAKAAAEHGIENTAKWVRSERGEAMQD